MSSGAPMAFMLAGGTGGHVYPALALARELRERGFRLRWIGSRRGLEKRVVGAAQIPLHQLPMRGLRGKGLWQQLVALVLLGVSLIWSVLLMLRYRPALVVGMGGYASVPAALAAWLTRRPLVLQEQNAVAGSANRALGKFARAIATGFPDVLTEQGKATYLGNPVRDDLLQVATTHPWQWDGERPLQVLVLGGSLGARPLNEAVPVVAAAFGERCQWWHQCGNDHEEATRDAYASVKQWRVDAFLEDMAAAYAWADLVICRAGALTVAEVAATGRPAILVPLPHAIDDHQRANAKFLTNAGAGLSLEQDRLRDELPLLLARFLEAPASLGAMAAKSLSCGRPRATRDIADLAEGLLS